MMGAVLPLTAVPALVLLEASQPKKVGRVLRPRLTKAKGGALSVSCEKLYQRQLTLRRWDVWESHGREEIVLHAGRSLTKGSPVGPAGDVGRAVNGNLSGVREVRTEQQEADEKVQVLL